MINWKALAAGILTIVALGLMAQFAFLLTATWITIAQNKQAIEPHIAQTLIYATGFICALTALAPGGYVTAMIAKTKVSIHCAIVGALVTIASLATSPGASHATSFGLIFVIIGIAMTITGGIIWKRRSKTQVI